MRKLVFFLLLIAIIAPMTAAAQQNGGSKDGAGVTRFDVQPSKKHCTHKKCKLGARITAVLHKKNPASAAKHSRKNSRIYGTR